MRDFERIYDEQGSQRFSPGGGTTQRGTYSRFLDSAGSGLSTAAGQMGSSFSAPQGTNAQEQSALSDSLDQMVMGQLSSGLGRVQGQLSDAMQIGSMGLSTAQNARFAKEAAQLRARTARQNTWASAASSGLSAIGSIYGGIKSRQVRTPTKSGVAAMRTGAA